MPIRDSLATLRRKGASYRTIAQILRSTNIELSLDTLSRFCREHVEERQTARRDKRRSSNRTPPAPADDTAPPEHPATTKPDSPAPDKVAKEPQSPPPPRGKGPRIADPSSI